MNLKSSVCPEVFTLRADPSNFIFEINVGKSRIRHTTTLKLNDEFPDRLKSIEDDFIQSRSMSDSSLSDNNFEK